MSTLADVTPVDLSDSRSYVAVSPTPGWPTCAATTPCTGRTSRWARVLAVTRYEDCVAVNRDYERFSSAARGTMPFELDDDEIAQQGLMMLNMDPPLHTRYRRLVNKGFTPGWSATSRRASTGPPTPSSTRSSRQGEADFVTQLSAELPCR